MPIISVILPCYNVEKYIDRCLMSITSQSIGVEQLEIICVDDASTDGTWDKLREWESRFSENIAIIHCEVNGKQGTARNIGMQYATAPYVAFVDADDWVELDYFERLYEPVLTADYDVVTSECQRDESSELTFFECRATGKNSRSMTIDSTEKRKTFFALSCNGYAACGKLIKRQVLVENEIVFLENISYEDVYFVALLHFYVKRLYILEEKLYHYYVNSTSTVLRKGADYHADWLTMQLRKWKTWEERDFLADYREELEYEFLWSCYLSFLKILALRYEEPPYSLFLLAKEITMTYVPDYQNNKYVEEGLTEFQKLLLQTLSLPIDRMQFEDVMEMVRRHGA